MRCGHVADVEINGEPLCSLCYPMTNQGKEIDLSPPSLDGRVAVCAFCEQMHPSSWDLNEFRYGGTAPEGVPDEVIDAFDRQMEKIEHTRQEIKQSGGITFEMLDMLRESRFEALRNVRVMAPIDSYYCGCADE